MRGRDRAGAGDVDPLSALQETEEVSAETKRLGLGAGCHRPHPCRRTADGAAALDAAGVSKQHQDGSAGPAELGLCFRPDRRGHADASRALVGCGDQVRPAEPTVSVLIRQSTGRRGGERAFCRPASCRSHGGGGRTSYAPQNPPCEQRRKDLARKLLRLPIPRSALWVVAFYAALATCTALWWHWDQAACRGC